MKLYTLSEPTSYKFSKQEEEQELSLLELSQSSDWDSKEFDQISDLRVGEVIYFGSLRVDRIE